MAAAVEETELLSPGRVKEEEEEEEAEGGEHVGDERGSCGAAAVAAACVITGDPAFTGEAADRAAMALDRVGEEEEEEGSATRGSRFTAATEVGL